MQRDPFEIAQEALSGWSRALDQSEKWRRRAYTLEDALMECAAYFDAREDVEDGPNGEPVANDAMLMLMKVEEALKS